MKKNKGRFLLSILCVLMAFMSCDFGYDGNEQLANKLIPKLNGYWQTNDYKDILYCANDYVIFNDVKYSFKKRYASDWGGGEPDKAYVLRINEEDKEPYSLLHLEAYLDKDKKVTSLSIEDYTGEKSLYYTNFDYVGKTKAEVDKAKTEYKEALIKKLSGTRWIVEYAEDNFPETIIFADDSVTIDNVNYPVTFNDYYINAEMDEELEWGCVLYFCVNSRYYGIDKLFGYSYYFQADEIFLRNIQRYNNGHGNSYKRDTSYPGTGTGGSQSDSSVTGTYSYTGATGSEMNGSVTLSDGNWTYSGEKTSIAAKTGTYTVSGSKVTLKWTAAGIDVTESFTLSDLGDGTVKWISDNAYNSTFLSMVFGIAGKTEVILGKE